MQGHEHRLAGYKNPYQKGPDVTNPNAVLQDVIAKQDIQKNVHLSLDSSNHEVL